MSADIQRAVTVISSHVMFRSKADDRVFGAVTLVERMAPVARSRAEEIVRFLEKEGFLSAKDYDGGQRILKLNVY